MHLCYIAFLHLMHFDMHMFPTSNKPSRSSQECQRSFELLNNSIMTDVHQIVTKFDNHVTNNNYWQTLNKTTVGTNLHVHKKYSKGNKFFLFYVKSHIDWEQFIYIGEKLIFILYKFTCDQHKHMHTYYQYMYSTVQKS